MKISVIIPAYNASEKIGRCIASLKRQTIAATDYEVIFIDDASTDKTFDILESFCSEHSNWTVHRLNENSGSPSRPRNIGITHSKGDYIFFLDCDDEIYTDTLEKHLDYAIRYSCDVVRGYLMVNNGSSLTAFNKISNWNQNSPKNEKIKIIIKEQSSTNTSLVARSLLLNNSIQWEEHIRMSEDTLFLADILAKSESIGYIDHPTFIYNKLPATTASSTQTYGDRELSNHIEVWREVERRLAHTGISYVNSRLGVALKEAMLSLYYKNKEPVREKTFKQFSEFINLHWHHIRTHTYIPKISKIIEAARASDFQSFNSAIKPTLLIVGYDLKFITPYLTSLEEKYHILIDEWTGHNQHNEQQSKHLLKQADYIWCEWLLGNAVWYSRQKKSNQKLIFRIHRFELSREFGNLVQIENIDYFVAVSPYFLEEAIRAFPNIPRKKIRLIYNGVSTNGYSQINPSKSQFNIGMIGITPSRKGFDKAIEILLKIRRFDSRYKLHIFGEHPLKTSWIVNNSEELKYFNQCFEDISEFNLTEHIIFHGHSNMKSALKDNDVGIVLSLSNQDCRKPHPESFHLAIADALASGAIPLILKWPGAEYIWPTSCMSNNIKNLIEKIKSFTPESIANTNTLWRTELLKKYNEHNLTKSIFDLLKE